MESLGALLLSPKLVATGAPAGQALENLNTAVLGDGALCYVIGGAGQGMWQLQKTSTAAANGTSVVAPIAGPGRWFLKLAPGSSLFSQIQTGRFAMTPPAAGAQTIPLAPISGDFALSNNRVQIEGPGIVLVQAVGTFTCSNSGTLSLATTTLGVNANGQSFAAETPDPAPYNQGAFYKTILDLEEVWFTSNHAPSPPILFNTFATVVKIPILL